MTKVSIIVPNYNHEKYLPARLDSVLEQTYPDCEVLLLDDASTDGSRALLQERARHPRVSRLVLNRERAGTFEQWRRALSVARGDYVWIAESDDVAERSFLEELVPILDENQEVGLAYCQSLVIDGSDAVLWNNERWTNDLDGALFRGSFRMAGMRALSEFLIFKNVIPNTSAVLFRKRLFGHVPLEISKFRYTGDWMAWSAMLAHSDLYFTPKTLNRFRDHAGTTRVKRTFDQTAQYLNENYRVIDFIARNASVSRATLGRAHRLLAEKFYRDIGLGHLLEPASRALAHDLSAFDPWLRVRLARFALSAAKQRIVGASGRPRERDAASNEVRFRSDE